jgi:hypothetical protein
VRYRINLIHRWTTDRILKEYKFCNVYRVLDKTTQFIIRDVIETGSQDPIDVVFRVVLFNTFTKIDTFRFLEKELGPLTWERFNRKEYETVLRRAREEDGKILFTGAFQKPQPAFHEREHFVNHLALVEDLMTNDLTGHIQQATYMADIFEWILSFPGQGEFTAYQLLLNLSYTSVMNFSDMDFVIGGPGARAGLSKLFPGISLPGMEVAAMRWLVDTQDEHFARLGLTFNGLGPDHLPLRLADIEHLLCELDKYARIAHPGIKATYGQHHTHTKGGRFEPSNDPFPSAPCLPKAWPHPDRQILRVKPGPRTKLDKRYVVKRIVKEKEEDGQLRYLIEWVGYSMADATWEDAETILEDAPEVVRQYKALAMPEQPMKRQDIK